jgi:hypothetical protein
MRQPCYVCEIKFSKNEIDGSIIDEVQKKIESLKCPKGFSYRPVLIHVNGVNESVIDSDYFAAIIDFGNLLQKLSWALRLYLQMLFLVINYSIMGLFYNFDFSYSYIINR